jgi:hypothetical protein
MPVANKYPKAYPCCSMPEMIPLARSGQSSRAVAAALPYSPPMAMPKSARTARNCLYVLQKPVPSSRMMNRMLFTTKGHFKTVSRKTTQNRILVCQLLTLRPYRSAAIPNVTAPTERNISTSVMPHVMSVLERSKASAKSVTVKDTVKKSCATIGLVHIVSGDVIIENSLRVY